MKAGYEVVNHGYGFDFVIVANYHHTNKVCSYAYPKLTINLDVERKNKVNIGVWKQKAK